jgi:hypothetical protein
MRTVQMGSTHCATQAGMARDSWPAWPFGPRPRSRGALAADAPWRPSGRLWPAGGDGQWGTVARERGDGGGPVEVGEGLAGLTWGCPRWCGSTGRSWRWGRGPAVAGGAGVVGDGLRIREKLVEVAAGQSMVGGSGARGSAHGGSCRGDLVAEARAGGRWCRLGVREAAGDRCTAHGGGGWTRRSLEWAGDREVPSIEEANDVVCFGSWRPPALDLVMEPVDA